MSKINLSDSEKEIINKAFEILSRFDFETILNLFIKYQSKKAIEHIKIKIGLNQIERTNKI